MRQEPFVNVTRGPEGGPYACPCCGYLTLDERGRHGICPVCFWEDDGQDEHAAGTIRGGPTHGLSRPQARDNFARTGAGGPRYVDKVRDPAPHEHPLARVR